MSKEYYSKEIERIKSVLADYYDTDFDSDEEDFLVNKSNKQLIEKLIINLKNDDELDVSNKNFFIKEALQLLAKNLLPIRKGLIFANEGFCNFKNTN